MRQTIYNIRIVVSLWVSDFRGEVQKVAQASQFLDMIDTTLFYKNSKQSDSPSDALVLKLPKI